MTLPMNSPGTSPNRTGRTYGVEEEFLLIDLETGRPVPGAELALSSAPPYTSAGPALTFEVKLEQIEAVNPICSTMQEMGAAIRAGRTLANDAAQSVGARAVALGTSPIPVISKLVQQPRYLKMAARFGLTFREQLTCGFHVHVRVTSSEEGVAVLDRIRVWLHLLLALSANSPFWSGADSGYASFRYQAWSRWPTAGPCEPFGSEREYRRQVQSLLATGVPLEEGMVYFDARLSRHHPTVEVRIADVCMDPTQATVIATVVRALVETAAQEWRAGIPAPRTSAANLRMAAWLASQSGVDGTLLHPVLNTPCPVTEVVQALIAHLRPALDRTGDTEQVTTGLARILISGNGARRQREVMGRHQSLKEVVLDAVDRTHGGEEAHRQSRRFQSTRPVAVGSYERH